MVLTADANSYSLCFFGQWLGSESFEGTAGAGLSPPVASQTPAGAVPTPARVDLSPRGVNLSPSGAVLSPSGANLSPTGVDLSPSVDKQQHSKCDSGEQSSYRVNQGLDSHVSGAGGFGGSRIEDMGMSGGLAPVAVPRMARSKRTREGQHVHWNIHNSVAISNMEEGVTCEGKKRKSSLDDRGGAML